MQGDISAIIVITAAIVFPIFLYAAKQYFKRDAFCPEMYVAALFAYGTTYKVFSVQFTLKGQAIQIGLLMGQSSEILLSGLWLLLASLLMFFIAYWVVASLFQAKKARVPSLLLRARIFHSSVFALMGISVLGFILFIQTMDMATLLENLVSKRFSEEGGSNRFENAGYLYYRMALLGKVALVIVAIAYWGGLKRGVMVALYFWTALLISLVVPIFFSNRFGALLVLVDLMLVYATLHGGLSKKQWVLGASAVIILLGILSAIRYGVIDGDSTESSSLAGRYLFDVYKVSVITTYYQGGENANILGSLLQGAEIQSGLADIGDVIADEVFREPYNNIPPGVIPEVFVKYGWIGIITVMSMLGFVAAMVSWLAQNSSNVMLRILAHMFLFRLIFLLANNDMATLIIKPFIDLLPIFFVAISVFSMKGSEKAKEQPM